MATRLSLCLLVLILVSEFTVQIDGLVRMLEPIQRSSLWRRGEPGVVRNIRDGYLNCGGFETQWLQNNGCCGVCGDACNATRHHEYGGKYAKHIIAATYTQGDTIKVLISRTGLQALGYFEFRICEAPSNSGVTQNCLDQNVLQIQEGGLNTQFYPGSGGQTFQLYIKLPPDLYCSRCVLQFKYNTGYRYPDASSGCHCLGCGKQEQYVNCADVSIRKDHNYVAPSTGQALTSSDDMSIVSSVVSSSELSDQCQCSACPTLTLTSCHVDRSVWIDPLKSKSVSVAATHTPAISVTYVVITSTETVTAITSNVESSLWTDHLGSSSTSASLTPMGSVNTEEHNSPHTVKHIVYLSMQTVTVSSCPGFVDPSSDISGLYTPSLTHSYTVEINLSLDQTLASIVYPSTFVEMASGSISVKRSRANDQSADIMNTANGTPMTHDGFYLSRQTVTVSSCLLDFSSVTGSLDPSSDIRTFAEMTSGSIAVKMSGAKDQSADILNTDDVTPMTYDGFVEVSQSISGDRHDACTETITVSSCTIECLRNLPQETSILQTSFDPFIPPPVFTVTKDPVKTVHHVNYWHQYVLNGDHEGIRGNLIDSPANEAPKLNNSVGDTFFVKLLNMVRNFKTSNFVVFDKFINENVNKSSFVCPASTIFITVTETVGPSFNLQPSLDFSSMRIADVRNTAMIGSHLYEEEQTRTLPFDKITPTPVLAPTAFDISSTPHHTSDAVTPNTPCLRTNINFKCFSRYKSVTNRWCYDNCPHEVFCPSYLCVCTCSDSDDMPPTTPKPTKVCRSVRAGITDRYCSRMCGVGFCPAGYCECVILIP